MTILAMCWSDVSLCYESEKRIEKKKVRLIALKSLLLVRSLISRGSCEIEDGCRQVWSTRYISFLCQV